MAIDNYTPEQIEEILQAFFEVAGTRQYIGARYVPIFGRGRGTPIEWDNSDAYEPLSIVYYQGDTYTSRRYVPAGIAIDNQDYWVITGRYNAQVEQYRQEVLGFSDRIDGAYDAVETLRNEVADDYVPFPDALVFPKYGTLGQVLTTLSNGQTKWENPVVPSDAQAEAVITQWLNDHPEATTTVQDNAVTDAKLNSAGIKSYAVAASGQRFTSSNQATAPYDDLNTLPTNEIVSYYSNATYPQNMPVTLTGSNTACTVLSFGSIKARSVFSLTLQIAITFKNNDINMYARMSYGSGGSSYTPWKQLLTPESLDKCVSGSGLSFTGQTVPSAPYDDLNTIPCNEIISYYNTQSPPSNVPTDIDISGNNGITVISFSRNLTRNYMSLQGQLLFYKTYGVDIKDSFLYYRMNTGGAGNPIWDPWKQVQTVSEEVVTPDMDFSIFEKMGVIGDSYASGTVGDAMHYDVSWPQMLARKYGLTTYNFSTGGLTTRTWLADATHGLAYMNTTEALQIYIIALGINDSNPDSRNVPIGNAGDFTNESTPPDTFYGNMGVIYRAILAKNPNAVICFMTCARFDAEGATPRYAPYDTAIRAMASTTDSILIDCNEMKVLHSQWWSSSIRNSHPTAKMYNAFANEITKSFSAAAIVGNDALTAYDGSVE